MIYDTDSDNRAPRVISPLTLGLSILAHVILFTALALFAFVRFTPKETVIPIELMVVVNENLDGVDNEPPPLAKEEPQPPAPPPEIKPAPPPEEPPAITEVKDAVELKPEEKKPEEKKPEIKKPEEKKPEEKKPEIKKPEEKKPEEKKPEKTKEQLLEERLKRMRERGKTVNNKVKIEVKDAPSGNGRTQKKTLSDAEIRRLLNAGYKPGTSEQLAASDMQLGVSLVQMALNDKWAAMRPSVGRSGTVLLSVKFAASGRMVDVRLARSCGDKVSDNAALQVARSVGIVRNLPPDFIKTFSRESLTIRYNVRQQ